MNQIPNIEETHNTREVEEIVAQLLLRTYDRCFVRGRVPPEVGSSIAHYDLFLKEELTNLLHQQLQKAREGERKIIKLRIDYDRRKGIPAEETVNDIYDSIELKDHSELDHLQDRPLNSERD